MLDGRSEPLSPLRDQTVVIAGGTGFVGAWLAEMIACLNDDFSFRCRLVLLARGTEGFAAAWPHLARRRDFKLLRADVRHLAELPRETNWLIHAAATPDNRYHASSPVETMTTIVEGTANVVRALDPLSDLRRMLYLSSCYVYGAQPTEVPALSENFPGAPPLASTAAAYGEAKRCAETLCASARSQRRLPIATVRPFAFLGPYQALDRPWAANNFLQDALSGRPIRIQGDGETVRSYMYGSDLAYHLLRILTSEGPDGVWNVGSPQGVSLRELATIIARQLKPAPEIRLNAASQGGVPRTRLVPDTSAVSRAFGLHCQVSLEQAVERTLSWNRAQQKAEAIQ